MTAKQFKDRNIIPMRNIKIAESEVLIKELYRRPNPYRLGKLAKFMFLIGCCIGEAVILKRPPDVNEKNTSIAGTIEIGEGFGAVLKALL